MHIQQTNIPVPGFNLFQIRIQAHNLLLQIQIPNKHTNFQLRAKQIKTN